MKSQIIHISALFIVVFLFASCYKEATYDPNTEKDASILTFENNEVFFDEANGFALCPVVEFGEYSPIIYFDNIISLEINGEALENNKMFRFGAIEANETYNLSLITLNNETREYRLQFTLLPTMHIEFEAEEIPDEPKVLAKLSIADPAINGTIIEFCGIETRGGSANSRPKRSFGFEIYEDNAGRNNKKLPLLGMNLEDDWILDGLYSDKSCLRNRVSFEVWKAFQDDAIVEGRNVLPSATDGELIELFINQQYVGLYNLCEKVNGNKLNLKPEKNKSHGFLYKCENWNDVSRFKAITDTVGAQLVWAGWEQKYPESDESILWYPLYNLVDFVVNSPRDEFVLNVKNYIVTDQFIDFFILVNLIKGYDNVGQNLMLASKAIDAPFYFCPWDMDATWGRDWDGNIRDEKGIVLFRIYDRFHSNDPDGFRQKLNERYFHLRQSIITSEYLSQLFHNHFDLLESSGADLRENGKWPESLPSMAEERLYLDEWIPKRINVLDEYFSF